MAEMKGIKKVGRKTPRAAAAAPKKGAGGARAKAQAGGDGGARLAAEIERAKQLVAEGRPDEALVAFISIKRENPSLIELSPVLCDLCLGTGRHDLLAPSWITEAVRCNKDFAGSFIELAADAYQKNMVSGATEILAALLEADPDNYKAWNNYAICLTASGTQMLRNAEAAFRQSFQINSKIVETVTNLDRLTQIVGFLNKTLA